MNVLVTGGAGYIGSSLVEQLNASEKVKAIYVLDNLSRSPLSFFIGKEKLSKVNFINGDILDSYTLDKVLGKVDVVYHLAAYVSNPYNYAQNVQYEQINQWGTLNLVRCIQQSKHKIQQLVYLSSASVYGLRGKVNLDEEPYPTNAYGKSKLEAEKFVCLLENQCKVNIVRSANVYGFNPCFRADSVLNHFIFHGIVDHKILIYGNGTQKRPFVSLQQIVSQLLNTLNNDTKLCTFGVKFNADLNEIKDWLVNSHLPELEFTHLNPGISYEEQFIEGLVPLQEEINNLNQEFLNFKENIRIQK